MTKMEIYSYTDCDGNQVEIRCGSIERSYFKEKRSSKGTKISKGIAISEGIAIFSNIYSKEPEELEMIHFFPASDSDDFYFFIRTGDIHGVINQIKENSSHVEEAVARIEERIDEAKFRTMRKNLIGMEHILTKSFEENRYA